MAFGKAGKDQFCVTRRYGCGRPLDGEDEALAEMARRVLLWNRYVALDRQHEDAVEDALADRDAPFAAALAAYRAARETRATAPLGERTAATEALRAARAPSQQARGAAWKAHGQDEAFRATLRALEEARQVAAREIRQHNDCYVYNSTATYLDYDKARKALRTTGGPGARLRFQRWEGEGQLVAQFTTAPDVDTLWDANPAPAAGLLRIEPRHVLDAWAPGASRSVQRHAAQTVARFRVRSVVTPGQRPAPVWLTLPVVLHRAIPVGSIQYATVQRRRVGRDWHWSLVLTVRLAAGAPARSTQPGPVAVDLGWRTLLDAQGQPEGVRVALARDTTGDAAALLLSQHWLDRLAKGDELQRVRDEHADTLRVVLRAWRQRAVRQESALPDWFSARTGPHAAVWESNEALARLVGEWRGQRFAGDADVYATAATWRKQELHLADWQRHERDQLLGERRDAYRRFAKLLTERYGEVRLEGMDLRPLVQAKPYGREGDSQEAGAAGQRHETRWHRFAAAPSTLVGALESAARVRGVTVTRTPAAYTTQECARCGHVEAFDAKHELVKVCATCGSALDQDVNAAAVLLRRAPGAARIATGAGALPESRAALDAARPIRTVVVAEGRTHVPPGGDGSHSGGSGDGRVSGDGA